MADLLFYRANDGLAAVGHFANGKFVNTETADFNKIGHRSLRLRIGSSEVVLGE
jgi:hypothetical protein